MNVESIEVLACLVWLENIYTEKLLCRVCRVIEGMIDDMQVGFRAWKGYVDQNILLKQIGEKH